jgi:hypothetical protein
MCTPERDFSVLRPSDEVKTAKNENDNPGGNTLFHTIRKLELKKETLEIPIKNQITRYYAAGVQSAVPTKELLLTVNRLLGFTFYFHYFILHCPLHASS